MSYASLERPDTEAEHAQLLGEMTIQALQQRAQTVGVDEAALDNAEEKAELVDGRRRSSRCHSSD